VNGFFALELRDGMKPGDDVRIHIEKKGYRADDVTEAASDSVTHPLQITRLTSAMPHKQKAFFVDIAAPEKTDVRSGLGQIIGAFEQPKDHYVIVPLNVSLWISITNLQSTQSMIETYDVEIKTRSGKWVRLIRVPAFNLNFYLIQNNRLNDAHVLSLQQIDNRLSSRWVQPKENVRGWAFFEYPEDSDRDGFVFNFRVTLRDSAGTVFTSSELIITKENSGNRVQGAILKWSSQTVDLSSAVIEYIRQEKTPPPTRATQQAALPETLPRQDTEPDLALTPTKCESTAAVNYCNSPNSDISNITVRSADPAVNVTNSEHTSANGVDYKQTQPSPPKSENIRHGGPAIGISGAERSQVRDTVIYTCGSGVDATNAAGTAVQNAEVHLMPQDACKFYYGALNLEVNCGANKDKLIEWEKGVASFWTGDNLKRWNDEFGQYDPAAMTIDQMCADVFYDSAKMHFFQHAYYGHEGYQ
jgi:hypothetical protein